MLGLRSRPSGNFTINHLIYLYPYGNCNVNIMEAFIDVLLNETLMDGRPFKIIAILTLINEMELTNLADIMSPYFIPIVPVVPRNFLSYVILNLSTIITIMLLHLLQRIMTGFGFSRNLLKHLM